MALYYKAREYALAQQLAYEWLAAGVLPEFAVDQLRQLVQGIWSTEAAERAGIRFVEGDVLVSVKGGKVVKGGAPLDLIVRKVEEVQAFLYRTVEMLFDIPLRKRGAPSQEIQSVFQPWLFQAPAGSYQFAVRVQEPEQITLFPETRPRVEQVVSTFLAVIRASATDPLESLPQIVPDAEYRGAFLRLARNLAPTGKAFERVEIRDATLPASRPVTLGTGTREGINLVLRQARTPIEGETAPIQQFRGILRALHLDQDWLEIAVADTAQHIRIHDAGDILDDVVGPMVNRVVLVSAVIGRRGKLSFRDIEADE